MNSTVLVVFGGESWEREGSIISAATVARSLDRRGVPNRLIEFPLKDHDLKASPQSVVFNSMHGKNGEDGALSSFCEVNGIPYNFSRPYAHIVGFDKLRFKALAHSLNVLTPGVLNRLEATKAHMNLPVLSAEENKKYILKPIYGGGSRGVEIVSSLKELEDKIDSRDRKYEPYIVEEFIDGSFVTCAITGEPEIDITLPLLEVRFDGALYDYEIKHNENKRRYILPSEISADSEKSVREASAKMYGAMGCDAVVRFDYLVDAQGQAYLLEANTVPGLSEAGNLASIWKASGRTYDELVAFLLKKIRLPM